MMTHQDDRMLDKFRTKSLRDLETQRTNSIRGIEDFERENMLIEAMIAGLLMHQPAGYGAKIEELRAEQRKRQSGIDLVRGQLALIESVIAEKQHEIR